MKPLGCNGFHRDLAVCGVRVLDHTDDSLTLEGLETTTPTNAAAYAFAARRVARPVGLHRLYPLLAHVLSFRGDYGQQVVRAAESTLSVWRWYLARDLLDMYRNTDEPR